MASLLLNDHAPSVNGHSPTHNGHAAPEEDHGLQCRGLWIPIAIWQRFENGELSSTEVMLLAYIDGLVRCGGEGCWATNRHLAEKFGVTPQHAGVLINHLQELGLVIQVGWKVTRQGRFRLLETAWSRAGEDPAPRKPKKRGGLKKNLEGGLKKNLEGGLKKNLDQIDIDDELEEIPTPRPGTAGGETPSPSRNEHTSNNGKGRSQPPPSGFDSFNRECTVILWEAIRRDKPEEVSRQSSQKKWDMEFHRLRKGRSDEEIRRVLTWYTQHIGQDYIPEAFSATSFRSKFDAIRRAMLRFKKKAPDGTVMVDGVLCRKVGTCDGWSYEPLYPSRESSE